MPNGEYDVTVCIGSANYSYYGQSLEVEGALLFDRVNTGRGKWREETVHVTVSDGRLTLDFGRSYNYVSLDYVIISQN